MLLRVVQGGLVHAGPPCGTWVWLNRGTSKRSSWQPEGDRSQVSVVEANESPGHEPERCFRDSLRLSLQLLAETRNSKQNRFQVIPIPRSTPEDCSSSGPFGIYRHCAACLGCHRAASFLCAWKPEVFQAAAPEQRAGGLGRGEFARS